MLRPVFTIILTALLTLTLISCATSPLGRQQLIFMPDNEMAQLGAASYSQMKKKIPIERSGTKNRYVSCVSRAITNELTGEWAKLKWEVTVFKDESANAFALPGGKMGVHTGLLKVAENQHQLATVLGHEVGHVMSRHSNERVSTNMVAQSGAQLAGVILAGSSQTKRQLYGLLGLGAVQYGVALPFSRKHETEADLIGLQLMAKAGFDPRESTQLWRNMGKQGGKKPPEFLSTHPAGTTRINDLNANMGKAMTLYNQAKASGKRPNCG